MLSKEALSHRNYVEGVLNYYREMDIQQGDPNEGTWHLAHYPLPKRLGGQQTVELLAEHHAVQGVLQSEEYGCMCFAMWEIKHLPDHLIPLYNKWRSWQSSQNMTNYLEGLSAPGFDSHIKRMRDGLTPEVHARRIEASSETQIRLRGKPCTLESEWGERKSFRSRRKACVELGLVGSHLRRTLTPKENGESRYTKGWRLLP